ncbi:MAG: hypothetical protein JJT95_09230 [Pararhodobacter sp.]|nr:hypothetical protein [Pararhodobacter sp.]
MDFTSSIVAEAEDYQITLNRGRAEAATLVVSFDYIGSDKKTQGFGTNQAIWSKADNLFVSQRKGTSYQHLSREAFSAAAGDIFPRYDRVLFYGHSLGGYAALYYSCAHKSDVFAICPRCPAHPFYRRLLTRYSQAFLHGPIVKSPNSFWTVLWDPADHDNRFIESHIGVENIDRAIRVQDLGHDSAPRILTLNGSLQRYLAEWIGNKRISALPSYEPGTHFVLMINTARDFIRQRKFSEAVQLLERSIGLADTPRAQALLAVARRELASGREASIRSVS